MTATPRTADPDQLLTFPQAAQRLGVSTRDVQRMVRTEQLGYVLDPQGRRRIPASWVSDPAGWH